MNFHKILDLFLFKKRYTIDGFLLSLSSYNDDCIREKFQHFHCVSGLLTSPKDQIKAAKPKSILGSYTQLIL